MKLKNSNWDETKNVNWDETQTVIKLENSNWDETTNFYTQKKFLTKNITKIAMKLKKLKL